MITMTTPTTMSKYATLGLINISIIISSRGDLIIHQNFYRHSTLLCDETSSKALENLRIWYDIGMHPFSILLGLGTLLGLLLTIWRVREKETSRYLDAAIWILVGALVGSRAVAVAVNFMYYENHPWEMIQVWRGGLSGIGALAGVMVTAIVLAYLWKMHAGDLTDILLPLTGALTVTAWLGCWVEGSAYGRISDVWWALPGRDEWGIVTNRVPVQLLGACLTLVLVWVLDRASKRISIPGLMGTCGLFGLSAIQCGLSFLRADPALVWNYLRLEAWGAIGLMLSSLLLLAAFILDWKSRKKKAIQP
jgi:phosphatidylglycerol:prolipoprotein diacylglycerol transferase